MGMDDALLRRLTVPAATDHVLLDVDAVRQPLTGIGRYALMLARGLSAELDAEALQLLRGGHPVSLGQMERGLASGSAGRVARIAARLPFRPILRRAYLQWVGMQSRTLLARRAEQGYLLHTPNYLGLDYPGRTLITLHDLSYCHYPECHPPERVRWMNECLPSRIEQAVGLITDAESVRQEVIATYGVAPDKVTAIPLGVEPEFHPREAADLDPVLARYRLASGGYLLSVATLEPRKNLERLLDAHERLPVSLQSAWPLVLAGGRGWSNARLLERLQAAEASGRVRRLGYVAEDDLPALYAGARAFALPSLYEGFGLPLLEAMASGIPALASDRGSLPEVAGDGALLVDALDVTAMSVALERLLTDAPLRARLVAAARARAATYTWARCVSETRNAYRRCPW
ncbi:glycosyltransferase family 1 protein [Microvirgula curvata]|nr:alpha-1,3-rhamnosyl/mannosyltransferase [Microvirgula sp. AG722]